MRRYFAEMLGTFALVFFGTGAIVVDDLTGGAVTPPGVALTFGLVVMTMIYAVGDVSGTHLNPAVTIGFFLARRFPARRVLPYVTSQIGGGILGSLMVLVLFGDRSHLGATRPAFSASQAFALEAVLTAILMFVILRVSTGSKEVGMTAGIAVGGVIAFEAMMGGPISGASMNPARSLAPALVGGEFASLWLYLTAPPLGAAMAVLLWRLTKDKATADAGPSRQLLMTGSGRED